MKIELFKQNIEQNIDIWLKQNGWINNPINSGHYSKETVKYYDEIVLTTEVNEEMILASVQLFSRKINQIESFWEEYNDKILKFSEYVRETYSGNLLGDFLFDDKNKPLPIDNWANWKLEGPELVDKLCNKVKSDLNNLVIPKLDEYSDIRKLNAIANGVDNTFSLGNSERYFRQLIILKLSGDKEYDQKFKEIVNMYKRCISEEPNDNYYKNMLFVIEQIYEKMESVKPLDSPILI